MMTLALSIVLAATLAAAISDIRTRRIPNALCAALFVCGLALNLYAGWPHALTDLAVTAALLLAGTAAFAARLVGGGDVKLIAAAAGTLGVPAVMAFLAYTLLSGGLIAVVLSVRRGRLAATLGNVQALAIPLLAGVRPARPQGSGEMPYALAIFSGAALLALTAAFAPHLRILP